jgi:hypothetical protein
LQEVKYKIYRRQGGGEGMKMNIKWHEDCLSNQWNTYRQKSELVKRENERMVVMKRETEFYATQIEQAKKQGKTGFDESKFLRNRR